MGKGKGYIKLHREIKNHWIFNNDKHFKWFITVLLTVNYETVKFPVGNKVYTCNPGESFMSLEKWAAIFGCSKRTVIKFFKLLESDNIVNRRTLGTGNRRKHLLTVTNWTKYQQMGTENEQKKSNRTEYSPILRNEINFKERKPETTPKGNPTVHPNKKDKEGLRSKREKFLPPFLSEIQSCFDEKINEKGLKLNSEMEAEKFESYYGSIGWMVGKNKMKDWRKAVSGWIARSQNGNYIQENTESWKQNVLD